MIRQTSVSAFHTIKENGLLSRKRLEVYSIIAKHGPLNCRQIIEIAAKGTVTNTGAISGRLSELVNLDVIESAFERPCPTTGHVTIFWQITDRLPKKIKKPTQIKCTHCKGKGYFEQHRLI